MRVHQIEIFQIFATNIREIYLLGTKYIFPKELELIRRRGSQITGLTVKNGILEVKIPSQRVNNMLGVFGHM